MSDAADRAAARAKELSDRRVALERGEAISEDDARLAGRDFAEEFAERTEDAAEGIALLDSIAKPNVGLEVARRGSGMLDLQVSAALARVLDDVFDL